MNQPDRASLCHSAQRALLFNVIAKARKIYVKVVDDALIMHNHVDSNLTSEELDVFFSVSGEIAGDFPELDGSKSQTYFIYGDKTEEDFTEMGYLVYARFEDYV